MWTARHSRILLGLLLCGLLLRLALVFLAGTPWNAEQWHSWIWTTDSNSYQDMANDFRDGHQDNPSYRMHGYPFFLMLTENLLGIHWLGTVVVQQLVMILAAYLLARMLIPLIGRWALVAAGLFLFEPSGLIYTFQIQAEALMIVAEIAASYLLLKAVGKAFRKQLLYVVAAGLVLDIGIFGRPAIMYAFVGFAGILLIWGGDALWKRAVLAVLLAAMVMLPLSLVRSYNQARFGFAGLSTQENWEQAARAVIIRQIATRGGFDERAMRQEMSDLGIVEGDSLSGVDSAHRDSLCRALTSNILHTYPGAALKSEVMYGYMYFQPATADAKRLVRLPAPESLPDPIGHTGSLLPRLLRRFDSPFAAFAILYSLLYALVLLAGFVFSFALVRDRKMQPLLAIITGWFLYTVAVVGPIADARYRLMFIWGFCAAAAMALYWKKGMRAEG